MLEFIDGKELFDEIVEGSHLSFMCQIQIASPFCVVAAGGS